MHVQLGRLQHCQAEAEASRQLIQQMTADLDATQRQLHAHQVLSTSPLPACC